MPVATPLRLAFWFVLTGLIGLLIGAFFQAYARSGIGFYRMYGTLGLVVLAVVGTQAVRQLHALSGLRHVRNTLSGLRPRLSYVQGQRLARGLPPASFVVVGPGGATALLIDAMEPALSRWGKRLQDRRAARLAEQMAAALTARVGQLLPAGTSARAVVLTLRRSPPSRFEGPQWRVTAAERLRHSLPLAAAAGQEGDSAGTGAGWQRAVLQHLQPRRRRAAR